MSALVPRAAGLVPRLAGPVRPGSTAAGAAPTFVNKNPRNLERMRLARKQEGWRLEPESRMYWHRAVFEATNRHTSAHVEHQAGRRLASASSRELCVRRHLFSAVDVCAAEAVGRVLARRCLEAGITELEFPTTEEQLERSNRLRSFVRAMEEEGLKLQEPPAIKPEPWWSKDRQQKPWHVPEEEVVG
ncbi:39S ribosomal protein L18, mitochondrial [Amphibalanus amphitrite]|uniref:Large ribosomal subunit protein uL18m n=1 Tax=Amphibalanus amphitrite TaxID=1232801 RepID=A0A6A4WE95_AMPAM|nr:39S ribosomal protein L18, mitochondrial-like [Amphibalanus amphitrite]XP_043191374.1 39S ribosomal protein L18, mitochondrial-like [Amphibalanus amphitrite]XP_043191375.1 39S ribosomal protein L18, mitochondrial-like [Amphibalanus amphitrite]KAF0301920.1 39S ribosomal protein L18, mitochondrial [Amphibalanus amphitrite]KAF0301921.1 39S ribosomal protein L18, mitochondrial [Amphibalanus amphitrite]